MKIRKIEEKDKEIYLEMARDFYASPAVLSNIPEENLTSSFREFTSGTPFGDAFIFEEEGSVIGYGVLAYTYSQEAGGKTVWLEEIYIKEAYRGKGAGSLFIDFVLENIPAKRYRLETEPENEKAAALYRRKGFEFFEYVNYRLDR
ncbi:MAG: GNAT family N-acetyltransferase [Ruminococcaceae bacterium]|nr:GNAT family N-acetyltransferase [Oscillospiraceae bacterium]